MPQKLEQMPLDLKPALLREPLLQCFQVTAGKVGDSSTVGADQVMMVA
jgi:hypothetical protein